MKFNSFLAALLAVTVVGANIPAALVDFPKISMTANAAESESYLEYKTLEDGTIEITGCDKTVTTVEIPAEIDGKKVTGIGYFAFLGCSKLTSVTIPDSVTNISNYAFSGCSALMSIAIPNSVTSIGSYVFSGTAWLENKQKNDSLVIVNGILVDGTTCSGDAVIPDGVTSIVYNAFQGCSGLTSITIPNSVTSIGSGAFLDCSGLTLITILNPDCKIYNSSSTICNNNDDAYFGVIKGYSGSTAEKYAKEYERKFESLGEAPAPESPLKYKTLEDGTIEITGCDETVTEVEIPAEIDGKKVEAIGEGAFWKCSNLTGVIIPDSVTIIGEGAFAECSGLKKITIPDGVTSIGNWAFSECTGLTEITIPDSVTSIGGRAFANTPWLAGKQKDDPLVIVNDILVDGNACSGDVIIPVSVTSISIAFYNCPGLTSITILNPNCEIFESRETISNGYNEENFPYFNGTICGYENSTAQAYAEKYNRKFEILGEAPVLAMGDVNGDNTIDSSDASVILVDYSLTSTGKESTLTDAQKAVADIDKDGKIDSSDASFILSYYSYISTGGTETDMSKWFGK